MRSQSAPAAECSAAFFERAQAVKRASSYEPCCVCTAGIVRWHVNFGDAGGGGPSSTAKTGVPPCTLQTPQLPLSNPFILAWLTVPSPGIPGKQDEQQSCLRKAPHLVVLVEETFRILAVAPVHLVQTVI